MDEKIVAVIEALEEMREDPTVPKNVKAKVESMINRLKGGEEFSMVINKCLQELDDISDDANLQPFTRTQIWNAVALMEAALKN